MKKILNITLAVAGLAFAGETLALTQAGVPVGPPPVAIPGSGLVGENNASGPLFVAVYDPVTGSSLVQYLGLGYGQTGPGDMTTDLNFGTLGAASGSSSWNTVFANAIAGGSGASGTGRLRYQVFSFDSAASGSGSPEGWGISTTLTDGTPLGTDLGNNVGGAVNSMKAWIANVVNNVDQCNKANPCVAQNNSSSPIFWAQTLYGEQYGGNLTETAGGAVGTSLAFFRVTVGAFSFDTFDYDITQTQYAGVFNLDGTGHLIYDVQDNPQPVPLPAAVWLLMSGLAGFGVVSRRRNADATIAA